MFVNRRFIRSSLQENENEELGDEVARVTAMLNASEATGMALREELAELKVQCKSAEDEASLSAKCEAALTAQQGLGNASLEQLRSECEASVEGNELTGLQEKNIIKFKCDLLGKCMLQISLYYFFMI